MRRNLLVLIIVVITCGALSPATMAIQRKPLTLPHARQAVLTYETIYWKYRSVRIRVDGCTRHSQYQISCVVEVTASHQTLRTRDWATEIVHEDIRVHPGSFEEEL